MTLEPSTILTMIPDLTTMDPSALLTALPMQSTPVPPSAKSSGNVILLDQSSGWKLTDTNQYRTDISQQGNWAIEAKQAGLTVAVLPPGQPDSNATSFTVKVNLATDSAGQVAGVRCMLQDQNNYYQVALKDKSFAISKVVDGQPTPLTSPAWKPSQFIGSKGLNAGADIEVVCNSFGIGLSINGTAEIPLVADPDSSFSSGKVALFAGPGDKQANGYYAFATFGSFKADGSQ